MATIGIAGAGLLGRLLAWRLARAGHAVHVFDPAPDASPRFDRAQAAAFSAAGMLSPLAELEHAGSTIAELGWRSLAAWQDIVAGLHAPPFFARRGSLLLAHRGDEGAAQRVLARLQQPPRGMAAPQALATEELARLEPSLHGAARGWLLAGEGQIDPLEALRALHDDASRRGAHWHWQRPVADVAPGRITTADRERHRVDWAFDVRGLGARPPAAGDWAHTLRGVRGETVWLHAPAHGLTRPVRLLHPRHRVYLVPRPGDIVVAGATEIESEDRSPVSLRSAVELMAAAHSVMPSLAEARIVRLDSNLRPALPDHRPRTEVIEGRVRINGLYRHGWLTAPALVDDALLACGLAAEVTA
jgi:glycine oxidase